MKYTLVRRDDIEQEIIDNLQSSVMNRRKAEEQLFCKYSYLVKAGIRKYYISEDDAFNAYSDTVLAVIHAVTNGTFEGKCSLKTYFCGIFHHKSVDIVRKNAAQKNSIHQTVPIHEAELHLSDSSKSVIEKLIIQSDFDRLKQKLDQLSDRSRQIFLLYAEGYKDNEIAALLKTRTADIVKTTRQRGLKKLHELLHHRMQVEL